MSELELLQKFVKKFKSKFSSEFIGYSTRYEKREIISKFDKCIVDLLVEEQK